MKNKKPAIIGTSLLILFLGLNYFQKKNNKPKIIYSSWLPYGFNGLTIPPFGIFVLKSERDNKNLISHELVHWKQYQSLGLFAFIHQYAKENKIEGYDKNKFEIEARFNETDFCKSNYTYCVRNGIAKTVINKNFMK